jgi:hypothetical protein
VSSYKIYKDKISQNAGLEVGVMIKRLSFISVLALMLLVILVLAPGSACDQGAKQSQVPSGPPRIVSFKVASENIAPDEAPLFNWEVFNASEVTITQDGVEIYHIEALPDSNAGALLMPLHDRAYASSTSEYEVKQSYIPGVFPSNFVGAATGKPSHTVPENWIEPELRHDSSSISNEAMIESLQNDIIKKQPGSAEITALSLEGQVTTSEVVFNFVPGGEGITEVLFDITPPPCVSPGSSTPLIPGIKRWAVKNPVVQDGEAPQFEFEVTNPHIISTAVFYPKKKISEYASCVEIFNLPVTSSMSLPPFTEKVHASTNSENEVTQPYSPGVYPVIYQGSSSGRPATIIWEFGEKSMEVSAEITVCSPTGDIVSATVTFTIMRVEEQAPAAPQSPVITFTASRNIVAPMDPVTFTWNVTGDNVITRLVCDGSQRTVPLSGSENIIIMKSACYYITAENPAGRASQQQCITVQSSGFIPPPVFIEPPCPPATVPGWAPPSTPPTTTPPVAPITDGY